MQKQLNKLYYNDRLKSQEKDQLQNKDLKSNINDLKKDLSLKLMYI